MAAAPAHISLLSALAVVGLWLAAASMMPAKVDAFGIDCKVANKTLLPLLAPYDLWHQADHPDLHKRAVMAPLQTPYPQDQNMPSNSMPHGLKVVFVGDVTLKSNTEKVYEMIKGEKPDLMAIAGDLDYEDSPKKFIALLDKHLPDVPAVVAIGNHDVKMWDATDGYSQVITERYKRLGMDKYCTGEVGVKSTCTFKGVTIVSSGVGTRGSDHEKYLDDALKAAPSTNFRFCMWHKNQRNLQPGNEKDEIGNEAYETCRRNGAAVITGHNHSYARSFLLKDMTNPKPVSKDPAKVDVRPGQTWAAVVATGGRGLYPEGPNANAEWWAKTFTKGSEDADFGAMVCTFNADGQSPNRADCSMKTIGKRVIDSFTMTWSPTPELNTADAPEPAPAWLEMLIKRSAGDANVQNATSPSPSPSICRPVHLEVSARYPPLTQNAAGMLNLRERTHTLAFDLAVPSYAKIEHAYLQLYGASDAPGKAKPDLLHVHAAGVHVPWILDGHSVEKQEVWVSPDLRRAVESHRAQTIHASKRGIASAPSPLTMTLALRESAPRPALRQRAAAPDDDAINVMGVDKDRCMSPSLTVIMTVCD